MDNGKWRPAYATSEQVRGEFLLIYATLQELCPREQHRFVKIKAPLPHIYLFSQRPGFSISCQDVNDHKVENWSFEDFLQHKWFDSDMK